MIYNTGAYYEECNKWSDKSTGDNTWEIFQTFFQDAQRKLRKKSQSTKKNTGYHEMNATMKHVLEDTDEALIKMASEAVSDRETIVSKTRIIERLTGTI